MADRLRIGILGCGGGPTQVGSSRGAYLGSLAEKTGLMDVVAVCDIVPEHADYGVSRMQSAKAYTEFDAFVDHGLDGVIVATPVHLHAQQCEALLECGVAVLSEVTPVNSLAEAARLAAAVERTGGFYMLAENYTYIGDVELVKRMVDAGKFGRVYFAEGEYVHDVHDLAMEKDGTRTWRGSGRRGGLYCTHSLGPVLYITKDRVATVSCFGADSPEGYGGTLMVCRSAEGRMFKVRLDGRSPRPHNMAYYSVQGDQGAYESWRGLGDRPKVWLADSHEPSKCFAAPGEVIAQWHPLEDYAQEYIPDRLTGPEAARTSGHFGADYWMLTDFARAVLEGKPSPIDVYRALDYCVPGIVAIQSKAFGGAPIPVPDFRPQGRT